MLPTEYDMELAAINLKTAALLVFQSLSTLKWKLLIGLWIISLSNNYGGVCSIVANNSDDLLQISSDDDPAHINRYTVLLELICSI